MAVDFTSSCREAGVDGGRRAMLSPLVSLSGQAAKLLLAANTHVRKFVGKKCAARSARGGIALWLIRPL